MTYDPHKTKSEVRQGNSRMMNSRVLIWSIGGVILAFIILYMIFFAFAPPATAPTV